jgi:hypothetical protein
MYVQQNSTCNNRIFLLLNPHLSIEISFVNKVILYQSAQRFLDTASETILPFIRSRFSLISVSCVLLTAFEKYTCKSRSFCQALSTRYALSPSTLLMYRATFPIIPHVPKLLDGIACGLAWNANFYHLPLDPDREIKAFLSSVSRPLPSISAISNSRGLA